MVINAKEAKQMTNTAIDNMMFNDAHVFKEIENQAKDGKYNLIIGADMVGDTTIKRLENLGYNVEVYNSAIPTVNIRW